eukprot:m.175557 g.175557  ORF g.175557 m.175557 type:complete len:53 (+) comp13518_c2_seq4:3108-3266(+)
MSLTCEQYLLIEVNKLNGQCEGLHFRNKQHNTKSMIMINFTTRTMIQELYSN